MHDAESIFIYKAIKKLNPSIQIMIELVYSSNIEFLLEKDYQYQNEFKYEFVKIILIRLLYKHQVKYTYQPLLIL
jgi:acetyl-CoA C-acetyltransferase/potassium large conductance calcium-activated channel subfamily M alpha protein 1